MPLDPVPSPNGDLTSLARRLGAYGKPSGVRGLFEIAVTVVPLITICALAWIALDHRLWWGLALVPLAAAFLVRLFMIQHDCSHGAFFAHKGLNDWIGRAIGVLTLTPHDYWRHTHVLHHASSGALDRRGLGGVETLTVNEYLALRPLKRLAYRLYRHPLVMFGVGPAYLFLLQHRLPVGLMRQGWRPWVSVLATNLAIAGIVIGLIEGLGLLPFLALYLPIILLASSIGVWLFFVQHQFEHTYWARRDSWNFHEAALRGSSHYDLPTLLRWFTANIGIHHVHHLNSLIPYYRLPQVLCDEPSLRDMSRLTLLQSLRCAGLALWDEASQQLISFRKLRRMTRLQAA